MAARKFEFIEGGSSKFWNIELNGSSFTVQYGRIGTTGQSQIKDFASDDAAQKAHDKLIAEKTGKGYRETGTAPSKAATIKSGATTKALSKKSTTTATPQPKTSAAAARAKKPSPNMKPTMTVESSKGTPPPSVIRLDPADAFWVTYESHVPLTRPAPQPFDLKDARQRLQNLKWRAQNAADWSTVPLSLNMTREEAHFWFAAMTSVKLSDRDNKYAKVLKNNYDGKVSVDDARRVLFCEAMDTFPPLLLPLAILFPADELAEVLVNHGPPPKSMANAWYLSYRRHGLVAGFHRYILPYLTKSGRDEFRKRLKPIYRGLKWTTDYGPAEQNFYYAAAIGMHDETLALVRTWQDNIWHNNHHAASSWPYMILFGLGSRDLVVSECKRTALALEKSEQLRGWIAHTGATELEYIAKSIALITNKQTATQLTRELGEYIQSPETAIAMVHIFLQSKAQDAARNWIQSHRDYAIPGLKSAAAGSGRVAEEARRLLEGMGAAPQPAKHAALNALSTAAPPSKEAPLPKIDKVVLPKGTQRSIELSPADYKWVTYRESRPLTVQPSKKKFNLEEKLTSLLSKGWIDWDQIPFDPGMSREEAHFWIEAMIADTSGRNKGFGHLRSLGPKKVPALAEISSKLLVKGDVGRKVMIPLRVLFGADEIAKMLFSDASKSRYEHFLVDGFIRHILPYITASERAAIRKLAGSVKSVPPWSTKEGAQPTSYYYQCAGLGLHDIALSVVESWADRQYDHTKYLDNDYWYHFPEKLVLGLGSAELVEHHMRRAGIRLVRPHLLRGYLAHVRWNGLDVAEKAIRSVRSREEVQRLIDVLALVKAPEAAEVMFHLLKHAPTTESARDYLLDNPVHAAAALIHIAASGSKESQDAQNFLRFMKSKGHTQNILSAATAYGKEVHEFVRSRVLRDFASEFASARGSALPAVAQQLFHQLSTDPVPSWATLNELPSLRLGKLTLAGRDLEPILRGLEASTLEAPNPIVDLLREVADPGDRDAFAWKLAEMWLRNGGSTKDRWALAASGLIGGDTCAIKLAPLVRAWPGESQHPRAVFGLECLRCIGSDVALMQISGIACKVKFAALKKRANECMEAISKERQMSRAQLEDRIIPDCDLNEQGTRIFDYGSRQFRMVLGEGLKPMLRYPDNSLKPSLPTPNAKDNAAKAKQANDEWKITKKIVQDAAKIQAYRLEQAMVTGRRWTPEEFRTLFVQHPLMFNLVNALVWGTYEKKGKLTGTFRVTEDRTFAGSNDKALSIDSADAIGLPHAMHLSDKEKAQWGQLLGDYMLIAPFAQIGREIFALEKGEKDKKTINRYPGLQIPAATLVFTLDKFGWQREVTSDGGSFNQHTRQFYGAQITANVEYDPGASMQYIAEQDDQAITGCQFYTGLLTPGKIPDSSEALPLSKVDPVVISEVLRELKLITDKVKPA